MHFVRREPVWRLPCYYLQVSSTKYPRETFFILMRKESWYSLSANLTKSCWDLRILVRKWRTCFFLISPQKKTVSFGCFNYIFYGFWTIITWFPKDHKQGSGPFKDEIFHKIKIRKLKCIGKIDQDLLRWRYRRVNRSTT